MKSIAILGTLCLLGISQAGCKPMDTREKEVRLAYAEIDKAIAAEDMEKITSFWAPDAVMTKDDWTISVGFGVINIKEMFRTAVNYQSETKVKSFTLEGEGAVTDVFAKLTAETTSGPIETISVSRDYWEPVGDVWKLKRTRNISNKIIMAGMPRGTAKQVLHGFYISPRYLPSRK